MDKKEIEALIFAKNWSIEELSKFTGIKKEKIKEIVKEINEELKSRPYFIAIEDDNVYFTIKDEYLNLVRDFMKPNLSKEEIEILTKIINNFSYSEIAKSKKSKEILKKLEREGWIKIKKEKNKYKFILTKKFKDYFKIESN